MKRGDLIVYTPTKPGTAQIKQDVTKVVVLAHTSLNDREPKSRLIKPGQVGIVMKAYSLEMGLLVVLIDGRMYNSNYYGWLHA
jgi:hypothetical protein